MEEFIVIEQKWEEYRNQMGLKQQKYTKELFGKLNEYGNETPDKISKNIEDNDLYAMQNWIIYVRDWLIYCAYYGFKKNYDDIMEGKHKDELMTGTNHEYSLKILKKAMGKFIYPQPKILKLELAADSIISTLLDKFVHAVLYYDYESPGGLGEEEKKLRKPK